MSLEIPSTDIVKAHRKRGDEVGEGCRPAAAEKTGWSGCGADHRTRGCVSEEVLRTDWRLPLYMGALFSSSTRLICGFLSCLLR